jgi:glycosyltransferase involved in cell wall biosynthesis
MHPDQKRLGKPCRAMPRISVIVCTRDAAVNLQRCINSVVIQNYEHKELIIIDGASIDGTVNVILENQSEIHWWESEPDSGYYEAANKALEHVTGDWVYFLGADDYLASTDCLTRVATRLQGLNSDTVMAYGMVAFADQAGEILGIHGQSWRSMGPLMRITSAMHTQGIFHRREIYDRFGRYDTRFRIAGDYEFILRVLRQHEPVFFHDVTVAIHSVGGLSTSPDSQLQAIAEIRRARVANGLQSNFLRMIWYHRRLCLRACSNRMLRMIQRTGQWTVQCHV